MDKGIIYYTSNLLDEKIMKICQAQMLKANLPIVSCSLKPIDFGKNIVVNAKPSYPTMVEQIIKALENSAEIVFFCEHDVLYHPSHFTFEPQKKDIYYYNRNNWRWRFGEDKLINFSDLVSLSGLCVYRDTALAHYKARRQAIIDSGYDKLDGWNPAYARRWGYEPGKKKKKKGGFSDEDHEIWRSEFPNIDIRSHGTFSVNMTNIKSFRNPPKDWKEIRMHEVEGWNLKELFQL